MALVKCKECGAQVADTASSCPSCGAPRKPKKKTGVLTWIITGFVALVVISMIFAPKHETADPTPAVAAANTAAGSPASTAAASAPAAPPSEWTYDSREDPMRHTSDKYAELDSTNSQHFAFPYGDAHLAMTVRKSAKFGSDVYLEIRKGQFICSYEGCPVHMAFDGGKIEAFTGHEASGGNTDTLFLSVNQAAFVKRLKAAKTLTIETEYFQEGVRQFNFNTAGLQWQ